MKGDISLYKITRVHELQPQYCARQVVFPQSHMGGMISNPRNFHAIVPSDKFGFYILEIKTLGTILFEARRPQE